MSTGQQPLSERARLIRWRMTREELHFWEEMRLIPRWLKVLMIVLSLIAQIVAQLVYTADPRIQDFPRIALVGIVAGVSIALTAILFLFAYVNRDAKRRKMNATMWTLLAIFVPYLIGLIVYFLVREPLPFPCPRCGATVSARFNFCSSCKYNLRPACPECKSEVRPGDHYCPHCAHDLTSAGTVSDQSPAPVGGAAAS